MIDRIIKEIKADIENESFISALALALTLPDICGKAEFPQEKRQKIRYKNWYDSHIGATMKPSDPYGTDMPYLSGEVVLSLDARCFIRGRPI